LRGFAREYLPSAMVPTSWVSVDSIPTTVAGKVDLAVLLRAEPTEPTGDQAAPGQVASTELEAAIIGIWREVLSVPAVTPHDNFFDLGGHSLSAMTLVFRLSERFSAEIPLTTAFTHPTPRDMAEFVEQRVREEEESSEEEVSALLKSADS
jgi:acyl carrier protein